jgi:hypothetical protein
MTNANTTELATTLRTRLAGGTVQFTFTKINGEVREATGTTVLDLIPPAFRPGATPKTRTTTAVAYFDFTCMAWRSYRPENLISIDD